MNNFKYKLQQFMMGRYGTDRFNQFLMILELVCIVLSMFGLRPLFGVALVLIVYIYFRMFSKNIQKRAAENQKYLNIEWKVRCRIMKFKSECEQRKHYHIYKCPKCGQKLRVPRGKGKIIVTCKRCGHEFNKKS
jgi:DNA-directed RNA polymerase subunit RPC12/RpoP